MDVGISEGVWHVAHPLVSVVLAVRNEARDIEQCLGAIFAQDWPSDRLELIVADGESTDGTPDIVRRFAGSRRMQLLDNPNRSVASGLNTAIAHAHGDYIVRVDGHAILATDYVRECVETLQQTGAACVGGRIVPAGVTPIGKVIAATAQTPFAVPGPYHVSREGSFTDQVYLGAWTAETLRQIGGYDENMLRNQDYELNYRIRKAGGKVYLSPRIRSTYHGRQTIRALAKQYFWYGVGKVRMLRKYPESVKPRQLVAPLFVAGLVAAAVSWVFLPILHWVWIAMLLAYLALALGFSATVVARVRSFASLLSPLIYLTMHVSWGIGFWSGFLPGQFGMATAPQQRVALAPSAHDPTP